MKRILMIVALFTMVGAISCAGDEGFFEPGGGGGDGALILRIDAVEPAEAAPGDEVLLVGTGLDAERDTVVAGNLEIDPTVGIDFALSKITSDEESDAVDGQIRLTIPEDAEGGELPIKVVRGDVESNVVIVTVSQGGGSLELARPFPPTMRAELGSTLSAKKVGSMDVRSIVVAKEWERIRDWITAFLQGSINADPCQVTELEEVEGRWQLPFGGTESYAIYEVTWQLPAGATDATLYAPVRGEAIRQRPSRYDGIRYETDFDAAVSDAGLFTNDDRDTLSGLIADLFEAAGATSSVAENYKALYHRAYEMCVGQPFPGTNTPIRCKPIPVTAQAGSIRTPVLASPDYWLAGIKHAVLEYTDDDGNIQQAFAEIPL